MILIKKNYIKCFSFCICFIKKPASLLEPVSLNLAHVTNFASIVDGTLNLLFGGNSLYSTSVPSVINSTLVFHSCLYPPLSYVLSVYSFKKDMPTNIVSFPDIFILFYSRALIIGNYFISCINVCT